MLHSVTWVCLCIPGHIHSSCSRVMGLLCIPLSELVSFAFSTIPICPFLFTCTHRVSVGLGLVSISNVVYSVTFMNESGYVLWVP